MLSVEISQYIRGQIERSVKDIVPSAVEKEMQKSGGRGPGPSGVGVEGFGVLTRGPVNMMKNAAVNANDVYGRVILKDAGGDLTNKSLYDRMKNKINYGPRPGNVSKNNGQYSFK